MSDFKNNRLMSSYSMTKNEDMLDSDLSQENMVKSIDSTLLF